MKTAVDTLPPEIPDEVYFVGKPTPKNRYNHRPLNFRLCTSLSSARLFARRSRGMKIYKAKITEWEEVEETNEIS